MLKISVFIVVSPIFNLLIISTLIICIKSCFINFDAAKLITFSQTAKFINRYF
uniref:Uncharacterized protein n=1 Tax=Siphoviridae sp. ctM5A27 TaxID=2825459 RepID=A0A8S5PEU7_9CAUD|nr:MAG TPA: hypothetical protein [Siphoviridae sp. ctM5A27]